MNWLKAMLLMVVLGAILYGVNMVLNKSAPVETPGNIGAWSDGPIAPPVVSRGTVGANPAAPSGAPPAAAPPYGQSPTGQSAYSSANNPPPNPATGSLSNPPPPASPTGNPAGVYQPATPPIVNSDPPHSSIPAMPVGLTSAGPSTASPPDPAGNLGGGTQFAAAMDNVMAILREGKLAEGLQKLTLLYDAPQLNPEQAKQRDDLLGRLAGTVVYSRQHLLLPAYEVQPGDRLETIANQYQVPVALLAKINGIGDPDHLTPGAKLKVIRGPFMAIVSLSQREVTLVVQQCYAGRFKLIGMGKDAAALNGVYKVDRKLLDSADFKRVGPHVHHWVIFGDGFGFCGLSDPSAGDDPRGFTLNSPDAEDLFDILSAGSSVVVR